MKFRNRFLPALIICANLSGHSHAATSQFWNAGGTGGDGIWGAGPGDKNWNLVAGAPAGNTTWPDTIDDVAVFQDALGGTVTVFDPVQTAGISQTGANYTINAGTITLVPDSTAANPFVNVQSGTLTLDSVLAGSNGLIKSGGGDLLLTSANTYTGTTAVTAGTLTLTGSLASTTIGITSGANLLDQSGGLDSATDLTNAGTLTIHSADTIANLTNNAGIVNGAGTLTVTGVAVFNGGTLAAPLTVNGSGGGIFTNATIAGTFNGPTSLDGATVSGTVNGNITSTGNVLVSGSIGGGSLSVTGGALTLTGISTNTPVDISASASLIDSNGGLDATAILINAGTLTVNSDDTVNTYTQDGNGILDGTGVLTATGGATLNGGTVSGNLLGNITSTANVLVSGSIGGGSLSVTGGALTLTGISTNTPVDISASASLIDSNGGLDATAILINAGTLTVNSDDTVNSYTQDGNGILDGTGVLTAIGGATLNGGTVSGNLLGNIASTGNVLVSGSIGGGSLSVTGGTLTLTGISTNTPVDISASASLIDSNGGLDATAILINAGTLTVNSDDTVNTYTQDGNGILDGTGVLTATGGATLNGGTVSGNLLGNITSTANVLVSGFIGGGSLSVTGGTLTLTGTSTNTPVDISTGASLVDSGDLGDLASVSNAGTLTINTADTIGTLVNTNGTVGGSSILTANGAVVFNGGTLAQPLTVIGNSGGTFNGATIAGTFNGTTLLENSTVSGAINGNTTSTGAVLISGSVGGGSLSVTSGTLNLTGVSTSTPVGISSPATLLDTNGGLDAATILTNAGSLTVNTTDRIAIYTSNDGTLTAGAGTLVTTISNLNHGSSVDGQLSANRLTSNGVVSISGKARATTINIASGVLINTGVLGKSSTHLDIASGATLIAGGTQRYALLTTSGPGTATWLGNLRNPTTIAPGGETGIGKLGVMGNLTNTESGAIHLNIASTRHDVLDVTGKARFGGSLALHKSGAGDIDPFVPIQVVDAGSYAGNITSFTENLGGAVWFNPRNGTVMRIASPTGNGVLSGLTDNRRSTWISLYDDVVDPGITNITISRANNSGYAISSGIADERNPGLLWTLAASFTPSGLNAGLLDRLSPEVHAAFGDYATQATRSHLRTALNAPALAGSRKVDSNDGIADSAKSPAKGAIPPAPSGLDWELFAAADCFNVETDNSPNFADYELSGAGFIAGARARLSDRARLAAYFAEDDGSIDGSMIHSDESGWSVGLIGETLLDEKTRTLLTTAVSYGRYNSGGTRGSVSATSAGWSPGRVHFSDVDSDSLELFAGLETMVYQNDRVRVIPSVGIRYATGATDGFTESTPAAPGSAIALDVDKNGYNSLLAEMGITAETDLTDQLTLQGQLGFNAGIGEDSHDISATFAKGSRPMHVDAEGLSENLIYLGLVANYRINESISVGAGYRADIRSGAHVQMGFNVSSTFRF